ncbi:MAG: hypothetical protein IPL65_17905 [Lewinellaceae bacterium]|nr:hypothetical protein [Lewinellaceae bacterium]
MSTTRFSLVLFFLLAITLTEACIAQKPIRSFKLDEQHMVLLLDSTDASKAILYDPSDGFFDKVTPVEMSIQMKEPLDSVRSRDKMLASYRQFLQTDVEGFSVAESKMVAKTIKAMFPVTKSFANNVFPDTLVLIKTKARHYGPGVYYTRHNSIVIPADALAADDEAGFTQTMYHELSHVYTRLNPEKKKALYALIGFEPIGYEMLDLPATLAARVLHNPDGVDFAQGIRLKTQEGSSITAIPIIFANENGFTKKKRMFFGYLEFSLFEVQPLRNGHWKVVTRKMGSTLP